ncbi:MAG: sensor histidine kinase [Ferruginibacter sp.]
MQNKLSTAASARAKADIYFDISRKYSDGLKIDSALYFAEKIKAFSQKDDYKTGIGKYHLALSFAQYYRGLRADSKKNVSEAIKIFISQKEIAFLGIAYWQSGILEYAEGNTDISRKNYWTSIYFLTASGDDHNLYRTYFLLGKGYNNTSDYDSAAHYYFKALMLAEKSNEAFKIYSAASDLGEAFLNLRNFPKAYQYLNYGLKNKTASANKVDAWLKLNSYTVSLSMLHYFTSADSAIREFEKLAKQFNNGWGWLSLDKLKGIQEYEKQNYPEALKYLDDAYRKTNQVNISNQDLKFIAFNLGKTEFKLEKYDSAIIHLTYASQLAISIKALVDAMEAGLLLSRAFEKINQPDSALKYFQQYSSLKESVFSLEKQKMITEVTTRFESEKKEQVIKMLEKESEASTYLLQLRNQQIEKQLLEGIKKSQQLTLISQQNEINKLDASQQSLNLENEKKENEKSQVKLKLLGQEAAYQKLLTSKENQQKKIIYSSIAVILALGGYSLYRYLRRKALQNQQQILKERLRISRELHDEVGSTLSGILMYSHLTREQIYAQKTVEVEKSLNNIQQSAAEMVEKLSDIVWLVNPEKDSLLKLIERLEQYAEDMAMIKGMEVKIAISPKLAHINLPVASRRNIYMFCKEAINNAVKYSEANVIDLQMHETEKRKIEISVADDGKGFDTAKLQKGNGLVNMQQRAEDSGGEYVLQTFPGLGTKVSLIFKIT